MEKIILYHGSEEIVNKPQLSLGKKNNDYGQGFYCTQDIELAKEWARKHNNKSYVNVYEIDVKGLRILNLNDVEYPMLSWLSLLLKNRTFDKDASSVEVSKYILKNFDIDLSEYDIVIGYRADDSYFSFAQSFLSNSLSLSELSYAMKLGNLGEQFVLISEKAFEKITWIRSEEVDENYYYSFIKRDRDARKGFFNYVNNRTISDDDIFAIDLIRGRVDKNDSRLR